MSDSYTNKSSEPDYQTESDAGTLKKHAEITGDPKRHAKAMAHLQEQQILHQKAIDDGHNQLRKRVKHGLKRAFPKAGGEDSKSPFQAAAEPDKSQFADDSKD
jgi:hypothetical protein